MPCHFRAGRSAALYRWDAASATAVWSLRRHSVSHVLVESWAQPAWGSGSGIVEENNYSGCEEHLYAPVDRCLVAGSRLPRRSLLTLPAGLVDMLLALLRGDAHTVPAARRSSSLWCSAELPRPALGEVKGRTIDSSPLDAGEGIVYHPWLDQAVIA